MSRLPHTPLPQQSSPGAAETPQLVSSRSGRISGDVLTPSTSARARHVSTPGVEQEQQPQQAVPERVKVIVRVRPPLNTDENAGAVSTMPQLNKITLFRPDAPISQADFTFDKVLETDASQQDVFNAAVKDVVDDVLKGYNGTVMAYGQTGAGKTYTLSNTQPSAIGMIPRAVAEIFKKAAEDTLHSYVVTMSYIQIYMELIQDLLRPDSENLQIREDANNGVYLANVHEVVVSSLEECLHYLELGEKNRVFAFTHLNAHSSRSHAVVMTTVIKSRKYLSNAEKAEARKAEKGDKADKDCVVAQKVKVGKLYLVDLAGSERLKKSKSSGLRASEAISINKSLTTLGMCISARANDSPHVPFRDSKLTRLLQESLGGNAKTTLVVCLADAAVHADETLQSLQFGSRAMCIKNKPVVNERVDFRLLHSELMGQLDTVADRAHELEAVLVRTEEERDLMAAELEREKARWAELMEVLRKEAEGEVQAVKAEVAARESQLGEVQQQAEAHAKRVAQLEAEKAGMAAAHYKQVSQLSSQVQELLSSKAAMTAAHRQEVAALQEKLRAGAAALEKEKAERSGQAAAAAAAREELRQARGAMAAVQLTLGGLEASMQDAARQALETAARLEATPMAAAAAAAGRDVPPVAVACQVTVTPAESPGAACSVDRSGGGAAGGSGGSAGGGASSSGAAGSGGGASSGLALLTAWAAGKASGGSTGSGGGGGAATAAAGGISTGASGAMTSVALGKPSVADLVAAAISGSGAEQQQEPTTPMAAVGLARAGLGADTAAAESATGGVAAPAAATAATGGSPALGTVAPRISAGEGPSPVTSSRAVAGPGVEAGGQGGHEGAPGDGASRPGSGGSAETGSSLSSAPTPGSVGTPSPLPSPGHDYGLSGSGAGDGEGEGDETHVSAHLNPAYDLAASVTPSAEKGPAPQGLAEGALQQEAALEDRSNDAVVAAVAVAAAAAAAAAAVGHSPGVGAGSAAAAVEIAGASASPVAAGSAVGPQGTGATPGTKTMPAKGGAGRGKGSSAGAASPAATAADAVSQEAQLQRAAQRVTSAAAAMAGALARCQDVLGRQSEGLLALQARCVDQASALEATAGELREAMQLAAARQAELEVMGERLGATQGELSGTRDELSGAWDELSAAAAALQECERQLEEAKQRGSELEGDGAALTTALATSNAQAEALGKELEQERGVRLVRERQVASQQAAIQARLAATRRAMAALTIQTAYKRWRSRTLKARLQSEAQAVQDLERQRQAAEAGATRRAAVQGAAQGQALVLASMDVLREAVEGITVAFVGRRKELAAREKLAKRVQSAAPVHKSSGGAAGASGATGAGVALGRSRSAAAAGPLSHPQSSGRVLGLGAATGSFRLLAAAAPLPLPSTGARSPSQP